ncbi:uncharacterized protein [Leuresthes tenuis]|uniref:uncharacterized protein n=1 Tax=Leuresthes tenuis TaxID=355514 RepID=UPI003B50BF77
MNVFEELHSRTYSEVMQDLCENEHLLKLFENIEPKRTTIQAYQDDSGRKHPLLGMQHLVECVCVQRAENRYYLCTLCSLTVANHMIIKHVLSFDHIYCYFKAWHPSTLLSKESYQHNDSVPHMMIDLAKQTEQIHGTTSASMKPVSLEPDAFKSVNFTCYAEALRKLESITRSILTASIKPGDKLEYRAAVAWPKSSSKKLQCLLRCQVKMLTLAWIELLYQLLLRPQVRPIN